MKEIGLPTDTVKVKTPTGGFHYYYLSYKEFPTYRISGAEFNKGIFNGVTNIDVLCEKYVVIAPPTKWTEGNSIGAYEFVSVDNIPKLRSNQVRDFLDAIIFDASDENITELEIIEKIHEILSPLSVDKNELHDFALSLVSLFHYYRIDKNLAKEFVLGCPPYVEISNERNFDYLEAVYSNSNELKFKELINKYTPSLIKLIESIQYDQFKVFKKVEGWKGVKNYLSHSMQGMRRMSYEYKEGESKYCGFKLISDYYLRKYTIMNDPYSSMSHHILQFDSIYGPHEIVETTKLLAINTASDEITNFSKNMFKELLSHVIDHLKVNDQIQEIIQERLTGFTYENGEIHYRETGSTQHQFRVNYNNSDIIEVLEFFNYSAGNYAKANHFSSALKFGIASVFQWARLIMGKQKPILLLRGEPDSAKSHIVPIILQLWNCPSDFMGSIGSISTEARISSTFNDTTYPKYVDETKKILSDNHNNNAQDIFELIKVSDSIKIIRRKFDSTKGAIVEKNHASLIMSQNEDIQISKPMKKRFIQIVYDDTDYMPDPSKNEEYKEKYLDIKDKLPQIGSWIIDNHKSLISVEELKKQEIMEIGKLIWERMYNYFNISSNWAGLESIISDDYMSENSEYDNKITIRNKIRRLFLSAMRPFWSMKHKSNDYLVHDYQFIDIIETLDQHQSLPEGFELTNVYNGTRNVYIQQRIVHYLNRDATLEISSLASLMNYIPGAKYQSARKLGKVIKINIVQFSVYLDGGETKQNVELENNGNGSLDDYIEEDYSKLYKELPTDYFTDQQLRSTIKQLYGYDNENAKNLEATLLNNGSITLDGQVGSVKRYKRGK